MRAPSHFRFPRDNYETKYDKSRSQNRLLLLRRRQRVKGIRGAVYVRGRDLTKAQRQMRVANFRERLWSLSYGARHARYAADALRNAAGPTLSAVNLTGAEKVALVDGLMVVFS